MPARHHLAELGEINPTAGVHVQAQITGKMPQTARYQPTQLLRLGLIQEKLTGRAALTMLSPEKTVLRATLDHQ
jgi:F0F1-type ATP synthase beta subunit